MDTNGNVFICQRGEVGRSHGSFKELFLFHVSVLVKSHQGEIFRVGSGAIVFFQSCYFAMG